MAITNALKSPETAFFFLLSAEFTQTANMSDGWFSIIHTKVCEPEVSF